MRIPTGSFGNDVAGIVPNQAPPEGAFTNNSAGQIGAGLQDVGNALASVQNTQRTQQLHFEKEYAAKLQKQTDEENRSKALLAVTTHTDGVLDAADKTNEALTQGQITRGQAPKFYQDRVAEVRKNVQGMIPAEHANLVNAQMTPVEGRGARLVDKAMDLNHKQELQGNLEAIRDNLAKLAVRPGADLAAINAQFEAAAKTLGKEAGLGDKVIGKTIQDFKDGNTFNQVTAQINATADNPRGLRALKAELQKGTYAETLDPQKHNALMSTIDNRIVHLDAKAEAAERRRDAAATRAITAIEKATSLGLEITPETWASASKATKGTPFEPMITALINQNRETQQLLGKPIAEQVAAVQAAQAAAIKSGSLQDKANADRLQRTIGANIQTLTQSPLVYATQRQGAQVQPLGVENFGAWSDELRNRINIVDPISKQYGAPKRLLYPQEATALAGILHSSPIAQQAQMFNELRKSIPDDKAYRDTIAQIAPDQPVVAYAGALFGKTKAAVRDGWFSNSNAPDPQIVARTVLEGNRVLSPSGADKKEDGNRKGTFKLDDKLLEPVFESLTRGVYAGNDQARSIDYQAVRAYYAGAAVKQGKFEPGVDDSLVREAVTAVTGGISSSQPVVKPYGWAEDQFKDAVRKSWLDTVKANDLPVQMKDARVRLRNSGQEGQYVVMDGLQPLLDKKGRPVMLDVMGGSGGGGGEISPPSGSPEWLAEHQARRVAVGNFEKLDKEAGGQTGKGNINLNGRKVYRWPDGKGYSSLESMTVGFDGQEVLIPKITSDGKLMSDEQAVAHFRKTGEYLGKFSTPKEAARYAVQLERRQQAYYEAGPGRKILDDAFTEPKK